MSKFISSGLSMANWEESDMKVFYARVSSKSQNLDRQMKQAKELGIKMVFSEKKSGKDIEHRPELQKMLNFIREGDTVVISSLDRLGRVNQDITSIIERIQHKGAELNICDMPSFNEIKDANLRGMMTNMLLTLLKYQAEAERKHIRERQAEGIAIAKSKGRYKGGTVKFGPNSTGPNKLAYETALKKLQSGQETIANISRETGISRATLYRIKKRQIL